MIEVNGITKRYDSVTAVDGVSFSVEKGRIYGFLGPNGAGKSTTLNIMTGCLAPDSGTVTFDGHDIFDDHIAAKRLLGYLPEQPPLYNDMTPFEYLSFAADLKGLPQQERAEAVKNAMERTGVKKVQNRLIRQLSKGYRQRVGLAQAILGTPEYIILDEPTVGLDPKQIIEIRELIRDLGREHTVLLSTHILSEVDAVCDHVLIIAGGSLIAQGAPKELEQLLGSKSVLRLSVKGTPEAVTAALEGLEGLTVTAEPDGEGLTQVTVTGGGEDAGDAVSMALARADCPIRGMTRDTLSLEDVFLELTSPEKAKEDEVE